MIKEGYMPFKMAKTYYRIVNPEGRKTPLVLLHGGPGSTHNYFEVLDKLAYEDDRPLIMYDQIGCGESFVEAGEETFNKEVWLSELISLKNYLKLEKFHLLGQSWGGMLAIIYAIEKKPKEVKSFILSSTLSSAKLWREENLKRVSLMEKEYREAILEAEKTNNYKNNLYLKAIDVFMERYCAPRYDKNSPDCLTRKKVSGEKSYLIGWGENEFTPTGTLANFEYTDRLKEIEKPCLITSGSYDLSSPYIAKTMHDNIKDSKWELFQNARHMSFVEYNDEYIELLKNWLNDKD